MKFKLSKTAKKRIKGSVTILLVLILLPMMTFSAVIVDLARINMAKQMMSSAGDLAMNSALANYDTILKDVYGLFAMAQEKSTDELAEDIKQYFVNTLVQYNVVDEEIAGDYVTNLMGDFNSWIATGGNEINGTDFLTLEDITVNVEQVVGSGLNNSGILRKQIVEYMKYRAPLDFGLSFLDSLKSFQKVSEQTEVVEKKVIAQESTQDVAKACANLMELIREYDELVESINGGEKAVKGKDKSDDGVIVPLKDYDTQLDKYRTQWPDNYQHINKLTLVFLANAPGVDDLYLKNLDYIGGKHFIPDTGNDLVTENCFVRRYNKDS